MKQLAWLLVAVVLTCPALADDFKFGFGGGATFPVWSLLGVDAPVDYKTGWLVTGRALWIPKTSSLGVRVAGYYGQIPATSRGAFEVAEGTLAGGGADLNGAGAGQEKLDGVVAGHDAAAADYGHVDRLGHQVHQTQRDGLEGGPR